MNYFRPICTYYIVTKAVEKMGVKIKIPPEDRDLLVTVKKKIKVPLDQKLTVINKDIIDLGIWLQFNPLLWRNT